MGESNRRTRAEATRQHLLAASKGVFAERGYGNTTVAAITEAANTAHGTFYLYFKNKEEVFVHVISDALEELYQHSFTPFEELPDQRSPLASRDRIAAFAQAFHRNARLWRAIVEGSLASEVVEEAWTRQRRRFHEAIADRLRKWQAGGSIEPLDVEISAVALSSMIEWFAFTTTVFGDDGHSVVDDRSIDALTVLWERALGSPG